MFIILTSFSFQGFSGEETDFHFYQLFFNFLRYSFSNFPLSHSNNIFTIYFPSNSSFLKSLSSTKSNFSCCFTSTFILSSNSATSFTFFKSSFFLYESCSAINLFHHTRYLTISLTFLLFSIFSIFFSSTPSTSTGFTSSAFYSSTCSLYYTT